MAQPRKIFSPHFPDAEIQRGSYAPVLLIIVPYFFSVGLRYVFGLSAVGGAVIDDDYLDIFIGLCKGAVDRISKEISAIINRDDD